MTEVFKGKVNRREFIKMGAAAGLGAVLSPAHRAAFGREPAGGGRTLIEFKVPPINPVRIGFVGVGLQGSSHVQNFLKIEGVEVKAVCDIVEEKVARIQQWVVEAGQPKPEGYSRGSRDFERLCDIRRHGRDGNVIPTALRLSPRHDLQGTEIR